MTRFAETSVLVRYLTADPPDQAERAASVIEAAEPLYVTETILVETAHVLRRLYAVPRADVAGLLIRFLRRTNVAVIGIDKVRVIEALLMTEPSGRVSLPDALIWAVARETGPSTVYTFDRRFPSDGITIREP